MDKPIYNVLSALLALAIVAAAIVLPYHFALKYVRKTANNIKHLQEQVDSLSLVTSTMGQVDTLILDMSEYNSRNIEVLTENSEILSSSMKDIQKKVKDIDNDLLNIYD